MGTRRLTTPTETLPIQIMRDDDRLARDNLRDVLQTLATMRWDLNNALEAGERIPEIVKLRMKRTARELDLTIASLKMFLGGQGPSV